MRTYIDFVDCLVYSRKLKSGKNTTHLPLLVETIKEVYCIQLNGFSHLFSRYYTVKKLNKILVLGAMRFCNGILE